MKICCIICWEAIDLSSTPSVTKCGHMFHNACLLLWFKNDKTCPQCRTKISPSYDLIPKVYFETGPDAGLDDSNTSLKLKLSKKELELNATIKKVDEYMNAALRAEVDARKLLELQQKHSRLKERHNNLQICLDLEVRENKKLLEKVKAYELKKKEKSESSLEILKMVNSKPSSNELIDSLKKQLSLLKTENTTLKMRIKSLNVSHNKQNQKDLAMDDSLEEIGAAATKSRVSRSGNVRISVRSPVGSTGSLINPVGNATTPSRITKRSSRSANAASVSGTVKFSVPVARYSSLSGSTGKSSRVRILQ